MWWTTWRNVCWVLLAYSNSAVRLTGLLKQRSQVEWPTQTAQSGWLAYSNSAVRLADLLKQRSQVEWPTQTAQSGWLANLNGAVRLTGLIKQRSQVEWPTETAQSGWLAYLNGAVRLTGLIKRRSQVEWPTETAQSGWLAHLNGAVRLTGLLKRAIRLTGLLKQHIQENTVISVEREREREIKRKSVGIACILARIFFWIQVCSSLYTLSNFGQNNVATTYCLFQNIGKYIGCMEDSSFCLTRNGHRIKSTFRVTKLGSKLT